MDTPKNFVVNPMVLEKARKRKTVEVCSVIMYILIFIGTLLLKSDDMVYDLARDFDTKSDTIRSWLTFFSIASIVIAIVSAILAGIHAGKLERLNSSWLALGKEAVSGRSFASEESDGAEFRVAYEDILGVNAVGNTEGLNLIITSQHGIFQCLAIDNAFTAAQMINDKCKMRRGHQPEDLSQKIDPMTNRCPTCGKETHLDAAFCDKCGAKLTVLSNYDIPAGGLDEEFAVEPQAFDPKSIKCPVCGTIQRNNRDICWSCGTRFVKECDESKSGV